MLIESLSKTSDSSRLMVGVSAIVILAIAIYNWAVSPQSDYLQAAQQYEQIMGESRMKIMSIKKQIVTVDKKYVELTSEIESVRGRFFTPNESVLFFSSLQDIAEQSGVVLQSFNYINNFTAAGKRVACANLINVTTKSARLDIKGTYGSIRNFMKALEEYSEDISIIEMNLDTQMSGSDNSLDCNIVLKIYTLQGSKFPRVKR